MKKDSDETDKTENEQAQALSPKAEAGGYGRPPAHSRWKKGQSGNPDGPSKKKRLTRKAMRELVEMVLFDDYVTLKGADGTSRRRVPKIHGLLLELANSGLKGGVRATELILELAEKYAVEGEAPERTKETAEEDESILRRHGLSYTAGIDDGEVAAVDGSGKEKDDEEDAP